MATNRWLSAIQKTAQLNTITPANVGIGNTFTITINGKSYTFTATAGTVANVTAGLKALVAASEEGEFTEIAWADATTAITATMDEGGTPFTQTSSASGGTATLTTVVTTANTSPNDLNVAGNWSDGIPNAADDVILDSGNEEQSIWWNLSALSAVTLASLTRRRAYSGKIGLPEINTGESSPYPEYRATELAISASTIFLEQPGSDEAGHIKLNVGSVQTAITVLGEASAPLGEEKLWIRGTHASNVIHVVDGSVAVATVNANAATFATIRGERSTIRCGSGVTLTTINSLDSVVEINSNLTTLNQRGTGSVTYAKGSATLTTANVFEGALVWQSSGTITTINCGADAVIDFSQGSGAVTVTNAVTLPKGVTIKDPHGRVTWSGGFVLGAGVRWEDVRVDVGTGRTIAIS